MAIPSCSKRNFIYEDIRRAIARGDIPIGAMFTDQEMARRFGISRTPVREALQKLESRGYVDRVPMRGYRVRGPSSNELADVYAIRWALETLALRYAALYITESDLDKLTCSLADAKDSVSMAKGCSGYPAVFERFDEVAFEACGSARLIELIHIPYSPLESHSFVMDSSPQGMAQSLSRRERLFEALKTHDPAAARDIWTEQLFAEYSGLHGSRGRAMESEVAAVGGMQCSSKRSSSSRYSWGPSWATTSSCRREP